MEFKIIVKDRVGQSGAHCLAQRRNREHLAIPAGCGVRSKSIRLGLRFKVVSKWKQVDRFGPLRHRNGFN
jgi:hypothetical protein